MKTLFSTLAGLFVVVILAAVVIGSIFWSRLPDLIAHHLSEKMQVDVSIANLRAKWEEIDINQIRIANLPKSVLANAFTCQQIAIKAPYLNYLKQHVVLEEIDLDSVYLGLEFDSASSTNGNWTRIMGNLQSSTQNPTQDSSYKSNKKEQSTSSSVSNRTLLIRKLVLTNIDVDVVYRKDGSRIHKLPRIPRIELTNISSEGGIPMDQIMNSVLGEMLKQVFIKQNLKNMLQEFLQPQNQLRDYLSPFNRLFNILPQNQEEALHVTVS